MRAYVSIFFLFIASVSPALEFETHLYGGIGAASGSFVDAVDARYASLGASSFSDPGSSRLGFPSLFGGGLGLSWKTQPSRSTALVADYGYWGLFLVGEKADGGDFASLGFSCGALSLGFELRWRPLPLFELSLAPSLGLILSDYRIVEVLAGTESQAVVEPLFLDRPFLAAGIGFSYFPPLGEGRLALGLRGELGLTPLSADSGALGGDLAYPWRALLFARYAFTREARR